MTYATESALPTLLGELPVRRRGLRLAGVPLVVGELWKEPVEKAVRRLRLIRAGVLRLQPVYVLAVRICLGYAVSVLDYPYCSRRCCVQEIRGVQGALDASRARARFAPTLPGSPPPARTCLHPSSTPLGLGPPLPGLVCGLWALSCAPPFAHWRVRAWPLVRPRPPGGPPGPAHVPSALAVRWASAGWVWRAAPVAAL